MIETAKRHVIKKKVPGNIKKSIDKKSWGTKDGRD